ncbi:aminodeoxychorismate lyase [Bacteroidota bacterium]|nr:aminodeoxychorismate lyase [Bacteroidota bacterium]
MIKKKKNSSLKKILISFAVLAFFSLVGMGVSLYQKIYSPNVIGNEDKRFLYIPTGTTFSQLVSIIMENKFVLNTETFRWVAEQMSLPEHIIPGRYEVRPGMSNFALVKLLRSGKQNPVKIVINKFRTPEEFALFISTKLEIDEKVFIELLNDEAILAKFGFTPSTVLCCFIPNTYEFYWNTSPEKFMVRMKKEYDLFWNENRKQEAAHLGISVNDVCTLASILEEETNRNDEKPTIASVYLNRLNKGMLLQADPTIKYAMGDFTIKRVTGFYIDETKNSPYNTYRKQGLPPGPICTPSVASIESVLQPAQTDYLYFCASVNKPNYHDFASTYSEHQKNARLYQQYLNKRGIH